MRNLAVAPLTTAEFHSAALAAVEAPGPRIAVFDCDGTLWSGDAGTGFMRWTMEKGLLSPDAVAWLDTRYQGYLAGQVPELDICGQMVQVYRGLTDAAMRIAAAEFFATEIAHRIFPELQALIADLHARKVEIWAVSSTNDWVIEEGVRRFGIPPSRVLSARVAIEDGIATGRILDVPTGEGKVAALARVGITAPAAVFGNSIHDAAMLQIARTHNGNPGAFPVNPTPALTESAADRRWPVYFPASVVPAATQEVREDQEIVEKALFGMAPEELRAAVEGLGLPKYRAAQLADALYKQRVTELGEVTTLPAPLREGLAAAGYAVGLPEIVQTARSVDGTERYLVRMADGETVETVWMPGGDGGERGDGSEAAEEEDRDDREQGTGNREQENKYGDSSRTAQNDEFAKHGLGKSYKRATICVSSQVGCAVNCHFCLTAKLGVRRNLTAGEIAGQVAAVLNRHGVRLGSGKGVETPSRINLVFMGMGEPFLNYDAFMKAVHLLRGMGIPESRMTVSTSGIEPSIRRFALEPVRPKLALSLNAPNDAIRREMMPITRKWDIAALMDALAAVPFGKREYVTFEYVLLGGVNDQPEHARELLGLLRGKKAKVNLIVWNPGPGIDYTQPKQEDVAVFHRMLVEGGIPTFTRRPRGRDIYAACGQLKRTIAPEAPGGPLVGIATAEKARPARDPALG